MSGGGANRRRARRAAAALAAGALALTASAPAQQVAHARSVLPVGEELLERRFADEDADGRLDLWLAVSDAGGGRALLLHRQRADGSFPAQPDERIAVPRAVICWSVGRFTAGAARAEVLYLARDAAFVRDAEGKLRRLAAAEMLLDMPAEDALPYWPHHRDVDGDGLDEVAFVVADGFEVVDGSGRLRGRCELDPQGERAPAASRALFGGALRATLSSQEMSDLFVPNDDVGVIAPPALLAAEVRQAMPSWTDANGDGRLDLTWYAAEALHVALQTAAGSFPAAADLILDLTPGEDEEDVRLEWADLGGGPAADLLSVREKDGGGASLSSDYQLRAWLDPALSASGDGPGPRALPPPAAFYKAAASALSAFTLDLDGDGRRDLALSAWDVDVALLGEGATRLIHTVSAHFAAPAGGFAARPAFAETREFAVTDLEAFRDVPAFAMDVSGDGRADLIQSNETGNVEVRPMTAVGGGWAPAAAPSFRIPVDAQAATIEVEDLNRDGVGDFIVARPGFLEIYLSRRA